LKIAVIPARGGSKRIPRKNIRNFCGKPIMAYSILAALESEIFDHVIVSTDDNEIASVAREWGAEVPFMRPVEISDDYTGTNAVVKHAIQWFSMQHIDIEYACCIYATAPFLKAERIQRGFELLVESNKQFSFSVTTFAFPIQRAIKINGEGGVESLFPSMIGNRSQDLEEAYHDAGQFYWGRASAFKEGLSIFTPESVPVELPQYLVQDIDNMDDWKRAELMYRALLIC